MSITINLPMWFVYLTSGAIGVLLISLAAIGLFSIIAFFNWRIF